jgi:hypothetical protein
MQQLNRLVRRVKFFAGTVLLVLAGVVTLAASVGPLSHSVTGTGFVEIGGVYFKTTVAAHADEGGNAWGAMTTWADLSVFDLPAHLVVVTQVNCVDVDGTSVWVGGTVNHSSDPDVIPPGTEVITLVRDLGGNGEDIMHSEFFEPGTSCTTRPALTETVVLNGNFNVR